MLGSVVNGQEQETAYQEVALLRSLDHPNIVSYRDNFFMGASLDMFVATLFPNRWRIIFRLYK